VSNGYPTAQPADELSGHNSKSPLGIRFWAKQVYSENIKAKNKNVVFMSTIYNNFYKLKYFLFRVDK